MESNESDIILREIERRRKKQIRENERRKKRTVCDGCNKEMNRGSLRIHRKLYCVNRINKSTII